MQITARELHQLASDVDDMHHEAMRSFAEQAAEMHLAASRAARSTTRRHVLKAAGVGGAVLAVGPVFMRVAAAQALDDMTIAGYAQSVELAAVEAYKAAAGALTDATKPVGTLFATHHQEHADAFGAVAGDKKATGPNQKLVTALTPTLQGIKTETAALEFAFVVENQAAYTYAAALTLLQDKAYAAATATILPIESQHAAVLGIALGKPFTADGGVFQTGAFESAELGDGTDPMKGLDPGVFA